MPVPASRLITPVTSTSRRAGGTLALDAAAALDEMATGGGRRRRRRDKAPPRGGHGVDQPRLDPAQRLEHMPGGRIDDFVALADQLRQFRAQVIELIFEQPDPLVLRFVPLRRFLGHPPALSTPRQ